MKSTVRENDVTKLYTKYLEETLLFLYNFFSSIFLFTRASDITVGGKWNIWKYVTVILLWGSAVQIKLALFIAVVVVVNKFQGRPSLNTFWLHHHVCGTRPPKHYFQLEKYIF